ncbi:hypothetical protein [Methylopila turkensis]|uniref:Uncharacterized protein n=1 Tax=Methylopila turkensis TaxID=1437816 RepID=A0A9W6JMX9_9HYPH|nr:hypothetical protein [Methylopila turkensis]GLK80132.1 hypothetical protein GCM10008174_18730 [Methylopila turkensis]
MGLTHPPQHGRRSAALAERGPLDTRELSHRVMAAKGFASDNDLRKTSAFKIVQALTMQVKRGGLLAGEKRKGAREWRAT